MAKYFYAGAFLILLSGSRASAGPMDMDYGPFLSATYVLKAPAGNNVYRGIAVRFDAPIEGEPALEPPMNKGKKTGQPPAKASECGILFDAENLRYAAGWTGGFVELTGVVFDGQHGPNPRPRGPMAFGTKAAPGWAKGESFKDPRSADVPYGPLPRDWARYKGLYRHDKGIVFSYTVGTTSVLDMPGIEVHEKSRVFTRTLNMGTSKEPFEMVMADVDGSTGSMDKALALLSKDEQITAVRVVGGPEGTALDVSKNRVILKIPALTQPAKIKVMVWNGPQADKAAGEAALAKSGDAIDLTPLTKGGKSIWNETITTKGKRAKDNAPYVIDDITVPFENPYKAAMRFGGVDFFSDGRAAVCTWSGDVWIVSGIDDKLDKVTWKRFASGVFQPLGLKIINDQIYTVGRDQITKYTDLNGDGEADFLECINNDYFVSANFHEFVFGLETDAEGNFYFTKAGPVKPGGRGWDKITPSHGTLSKVSKDGSKLEVIARGFRAPNGMSIGPNGEITTGDNEGTWTPASPINWIKQGGFYGVPDFSDRTPKPTIRDNPLCWLPKQGNVDNSCGGQVWITGDKFGPLSGKLLHLSYGTCTLFEVLKEEVGGQMQGGAVPLLKFDTGICRARFDPKNNVLYLAGLRGWQTNATKDAGLYRVRYTGQKSYSPADLKVAPEFVSITFNQPMDKKSAEDLENYNVERWNYKWTENYGSPEFKVSNPKEQGHDTMDVTAASLSSDGKTLTLKIADIKPVMQMKIEYTLKAADGTSIRNTIHHTINVVGDLRGEIHPGEYRILSAKK